MHEGKCSPHAWILQEVFWFALQVLKALNPKSSGSPTATLEEVVARLARAKVSPQKSHYVYETR